MTLIKSISGIRGTIGGKPGENLTPVDIVKFTSAFAMFIRQRSGNETIRIVVGRDARVSGKTVASIIAATLQAMGADVTDLGLSTTPTVELAVTGLQAQGGIIVTASHNPGEWNAMKLLNEKGEFLDAADGARVLALADDEAFEYAPVTALGKWTKDETWIDKHIELILELPMVNSKAIRQKGFTVAIDCVNSTGGLALPHLLKALGVATVHELYCAPNGHFPHNPEPLPEHLSELSELVQKTHAEVGFVVDPDVDRLAIVCEDGSMFGEEYTLVAVADYILRNKGGNTVSNLSSSRALKDVTVKAGFAYQAAAVGEVNVVKMMKDTGAVIGGEGNGGIIYPELHYGRDALVGIALFLSHLAESGMKCSELRRTYPEYFISKNKITLSPGMDVDAILSVIAGQYPANQVNTIDGVKIDLPEGWIHLRKSNTEPIIRIYAEAGDTVQADRLASELMSKISTVAEAL